MNDIVYEIDENKHLILRTIFDDLEIGSVDGGDIEKILHKVKLYDKEYKNLINQNELMKNIQKDFIEKDKEIERLNNIIKELREYIENDMPYLQEPDEEIERCDGTTYMTMKEYDINVLLNKLKGSDK